MGKLQYTQNMEYCMANRMDNFQLFLTIGMHPTNCHAKETRQKRVHTV